MVESWNGGNQVIFFGKGGDIATNRRDEQELSVLCLRVLQSALVYVNTLMVQDVLADKAWADQMTEVDHRGLTPLFWTHIAPYGRGPAEHAAPPQPDDELTQGHPSVGGWSTDTSVAGVPQPSNAASHLTGLDRARHDPTDQLMRPRVYPVRVFHGTPPPSLSRHRSRSAGSQAARAVERGDVSGVGPPAESEPLRPADRRVLREPSVAAPAGDDRAVRRCLQRHLISLAVRGGVSQRGVDRGDSGGQVALGPVATAVF